MSNRLQPFPGARGGDPGESINSALRAVRRAAGLSLDVLAGRTNFSKPYLSNVEAGRRRVTPEIAQAYDTALGTGGLFARLLSGEPTALGREAELARLHTLVDDLAAGRGGALWVEGEPGIGKSSLLAAGLARAGTDGCRVLWATADESLSRFPLWALLEPLRTKGFSEPELDEIDALLTGAGGPGSDNGITAAAERLVLLVERWCVRSPVLFVLDDAQWADGLSLSVWGRLRRLVSQAPLLVAVACRPVPRRPEVAALRRTVDGPDAVVVALGPLRPDAVTELTGRLAGAPAGPLLRVAADQAGGNPLYLREMVEAMLREDRIRREDGQAELRGPAVPRSLAAAIGARLDFLGERTRTVLRLAALLGPEPRADALAAVAGLPANALAEVVDEATAAGVLTATTDRIAFRHGLIRASLYEQTPPALRTVLHQQAAQALAETGAGVEAVAEHLLAGGTGDWATSWLASGAGTALVHRAPTAAVDLLGQVLEQLPAPDPRRAVLAACNVAGLSRLGHDEDVARLGPAALAETRDVASTGRTAWTLAYSLGRLGRFAAARSVLDETLRDRDLDRVWRARLWACHAVIAADLATARRALAEGEQAGDSFAIGYALHALSLAYHRERADEAAALASVERALDVIGDRPETLDLRGLLLANRAVSIQNLGRIDDVPEAIGAALDAAERSGVANRLVATRATAAEVYFDFGRWDDALAEVDALAEAVDIDPQTAWRRDATAALIALHRDDRAALEYRLRGIAAWAPGADSDLQVAGKLRLAQGLALEAAGQPAQALEAVLVAALKPGSTPLAPDLFVDCWEMLPDIVRLALALGRRAEAQAYTAVAVGMAASEPRQEMLAVARHCEGLVAADPEVVGGSVDGYERAGLVLFRAQALENQAVLLAGRGDLDAAARAYDAATRGYVALEAGWDLRRAADRLRPLGVPASRHRIPARPATGWEALTPTERKVAVLVAEGLSNPDVAARLQVSRRTVETHVAHILAKLGARSRAGVARAIPLGTEPAPPQ